MTGEPTTRTRLRPLFQVIERGATIVLAGPHKPRVALFLEPNWSWCARVESSAMSTAHRTGHSQYSPEHALDVLRRSLLRDCKKMRKYGVCSYAVIELLSVPFI